MFIRLDPLDPAQIDGIARTRNRARQICGLFQRHPLKVNRHQKRGSLVIGNFAPRISVDKKADLLLAERKAVPLFLNDIVHPHIFTSKCMRKEIAQQICANRRSLAQDDRKIPRAEFGDHLPAHAAG